MQHDPNQALMLLAGGGAFLLGLPLAAALPIADLFVKAALLRSLLRILGLLGVGLVTISATPFSGSTYCISLVCWLIASLLPRKMRRAKIVAATVFALLCVGMAIVEIRHSRSPVILVNKSAPIFVIGDSLSAGIERNERTWTTLLADLTFLRVVNLAEAGATAGTALSQTEGITAPNGLVLVEIGGNDMLGDTDSARFSEDLNLLLQKITSTNKNIAMFELPLLPMKNGFGRAQRALAEKFHVILIPKRYLAQVYGMPGATTDGLHFSAAGHSALARSVSSLLQVQ